MENLENEFIPPLTSVSSGIEREIRPDLYCLTTQIVNVLFVGDPAKKNEWILVDAGMPHSAESIIATSEERFGVDCRPKAIVLTHGHFDHIGAVSELIKRWNVQVYAHEEEIPYLTGKANYPPGDPTVNGGLVAMLSPMFPNHGIDLGDKVKKLPADMTIPGMTEWRWLHTPGHTPGHVSLFREEDRALIVGDAFTTVKQESLYKVIFQELEISGPPAYFTINWKDAWDSVKKLEALKPSVVVTGHGLPMEGETLTVELAKLAREFESIAIPKHGRFVQ
jgi:glyoxylase-like metal-dependent hydrolase (beta-lactamase superfamily II)